MIVCMVWGRTQDLQILNDSTVLHPSMLPYPNQKKQLMKIYRSITAAQNRVRAAKLLRCHGKWLQVYETSVADITGEIE